MANANDESQFLIPAHQRLDPEDLPRMIEYDSASDSLWLGNGGPTSSRMDIFEGFAVFFDADRFATGLHIEWAKELLLPFLLDLESEKAHAANKASVPAPGSQNNSQEGVGQLIDYDTDEDILWLENGGSAPNGMDIFDGCIVFFDADRKATGVMLDGARALLEPLWFAEHQDMTTIPAT